MRSYGAWVAILLLCLYLVFVGGGWLGIYTAGYRLASAVLVSLVLVTWLLAARSRPEWRPRSALMPAILLCLLSLGLSTAVSRHPRQSVEYLGYAIVLAACYLLLVRLFASPFFRARLSTLVVAMAIVLGTAFVVLNVAHWVTWWELVGHIAIPPLRPESESLTYGNPSAAMTIIVLFACPALAVVGLASAPRRLIAAALAGLSLFAIIVSGSRSGWLAIAIAVVVVAGVWLGSSAGRAQAQRLIVTATATTGGRALTFAGIALVVLAAAILAPTVIRRATESGVDLRVNYILAAGRMFGEAPLLGVGPGSWVIDHIRYTIGSETLYYIPHAHNVYAQTAAELGVVGLVAGVALAGSLARLVRDGLRDGSAERRRWAWVAVFALIYFAGHQLLDVYANMPAILFAAAIPVAWLDASTSRDIVRLRLLEDRRPRSWRPLAGAGAVTILAITMAGLTLTEAPALDHTAAVDLANAGDWSPADELASRAATADPGWAPYVFTVGQTAANVGDHERAADAFRQVAESDDIPEAWLNFAAESVLLGNDDAAREALTRAARLGLQRPANAMAIGELAERLGDWALAQRGYVEAIRWIPSLAGDEWWRANPERAARYPAIVDDAIEKATPDAAWEIALMTGDVSRAIDLAGARDEGIGAVDPRDVIDAWIGDGAAFDRVIETAQAKPLDGVSVSWAARLEGRRGDIDAQNDYLRWGYSIGSVEGWEVRVSDHQMLQRTAQGNLGEFWGTYTYRRPTPWNPLVPSLVQLTIG